MITANDIRDLINEIRGYENIEGYNEAEAIKNLLANRRANGNLFFYYDDFQKIAQWKLGQQLVRDNHLLIQNTSKLVRQTTCLALSAKIDDPDYEFKFRFDVLTALRGVGTGLASAILALSYPEKYCVVDYRGWYQVFGWDKTDFNFYDYKNYLNKVLILAAELNWTPQKVDLAIWEFDRRNHNRRM